MMTDVMVAKCCWVVTVNRQTGEATTDLWDDDDAAWQRSLDIGRPPSTADNPLRRVAAPLAREVPSARHVQRYRDAMRQSNPQRPHQIPRQRSSKVGIDAVTP
jgi:hypothetical protein